MIEFLVFSLREKVVVANFRLSPGVLGDTSGDTVVSVPIIARTSPLHLPTLAKANLLYTELTT
jgi:hypothetical protein